MTKFITFKNGKPSGVGIAETADLVPPGALIATDEQLADWQWVKPDGTIDKKAKAQAEKLQDDLSTTCKMSQIRVWLIKESYKDERRGANIMHPDDIDALLKTLEPSIATDLLCNSWNYATIVEFANSTTKAFGQMLGMTDEQLKTAIKEASLL